MLNSLFANSGIENIWVFIGLGSLSAMLVSTAKAGFGGSIGILSMPLMIYACQGQAMLAAGVMLPLLIACDYFSIVPWRGKWDLRVVGLILPGAIIGVGAGWAGLYAIQKIGIARESATANAILALVIGIIAVGFVALQAFGSLRAKALTFRPMLWQATSVGAIAGLTSTMTHAAGPIITMYMLPQGMPKGKFVATTVLYCWLGNQIKLVPYIALGMINTQSMGASIALIPAVGAGVVLGIFLHKRVGQKQFTGLIYALLAIAGVHLTIRAIPVIWP